MLVRTLTFAKSVLLLAISGICFSAPAQTSTPWSQEIWKKISGGALSKLTETDDFYLPADLVRSVGGDIPKWGNKYGSRVRGMLTAPVSGEYTFWISSSQRSELYLSTTGSKWDRVKIAEARGELGRKRFDEIAGQQSEPVSLTAGQTVFVEVLHKDHRSVDHISLAWSYGEGLVNWARDAGAVVRQSTNSSGGVASRAVDGNVDPVWGNDSVTKTRNKLGSWWQVDLGQERAIDQIALWNSASYPNRLSNFRLVVEDSSGVEVYSQAFFETEGYAKGRLHHEMEGVVGRVVRVESLGANRKGDNVVSLAEVQVWGRSDALGVFQAREIVPAASMSAYGGDPLDVDGDALLDAWEAQHGFDVTKAEGGENNGNADPDFDWWKNVEESEMGSNPGEPESFAGSLSYERWNRMPYYSTEELVMDRRFYEEAGEVRRSEGSSTGEIGGTYFSTRLRGYVVAPETGNYRFWLSSKNSADFYLSSVSGSKYHKKRIAQLSPTIGTVSGVSYRTTALWDQYSSQMSDEIYLEAGEVYYLEVIHQKGHSTGGHVSLAWAPPGQDREPIPAEALATYYRLEEDWDDDCLPDDWEVSHGLDVNDNGRFDLQRQGERGDYDLDGLTNLEEYVAGTSPALVDSDGDGLTDVDEIRFYGTDPTASNQLNTEVVSELDLFSYGESSEEWSWLDGGLLAEGFRGTFDWQFSVPSDGWWMLEITGRLKGRLRGEESLSVRVSVDGMAQAPAQMNFLYGEPSNLKIATPFLAAGGHQLSVMFDNYIGRRTLQITAVRVLRPGGLDSDGDSYSDWIEGTARAANAIYPFSNVSFTSPAFIEGRSRYSGDVSIGSSGGSVALGAGLSGQHWYANVPLQGTGATGFTVSFEQGQIQDAGSIAWQAWNAIEDVPVSLRKGDTLKLGAWTTGVSQSSEVEIDGTVYPLAAGETATHAFSAAGSYAVVATLADGTARATTLTVYEAEFGTVLPFFSDKPVWRDFPQVPGALWVDASPHLWITDRLLEGDGQRLHLLARQPGELPVAARLSENGPIVEMGMVDTVGYSDALRNDAAVFVGNTADGYRVLRTPIVVTGMPPGGYIEVTIFKSGVTFLDGTRVLRLYEGDFVDGVVYIDFRYPQDMQGGYCHYVDIYDADDNHLGRH